MSRRTLEATKAIRHAWENEQKLVLDGKGTRDWTPEQQQSIIEKGKAYDDNGKAFEGHHMKSAEAHPEFQSYPDNIEFLTRSEHQNAHGGNFQNPTNGYYDPFTRETMHFSDDTYSPCKIVELSNPLQLTFDEADIEVHDDINKNRTENDNKEKPAEVNGKESAEKRTEPRHSQPEIHGRREGPVVRAFKKARHQIVTVGAKAVNYLKENPQVIMKVAETIIATVVAIEKASDRQANASVKADEHVSQQDYFEPVSTVVDPAYNDSTPDSSGYDEENSSDDPEERSSPKEHTVPGHGQHYHTKNGIIWKEKEPYKRGGTSDDD